MSEINYRDIISSEEAARLWQATRGASYIAMDADNAELSDELLATSRKLYSMTRYPGSCLPGERKSQAPLKKADVSDAVCAVAAELLRLGKLEKDMVVGITGARSGNPRVVLAAPHGKGIRFKLAAQ